jgi:hypothetical protein
LSQNSRTPPDPARAVTTTIFSSRPALFLMATPVRLDVMVCGDVNAALAGYPASS